MTCVHVVSASEQGRSELQWLAPRLVTVRGHMEESTETKHQMTLTSSHSLAIKSVASKREDAALAWLMFSSQKLSSTITACAVHALDSNMTMQMLNPLAVTANPMLIPGPSANSLVKSKAEQSTVWKSIDVA